MDKFISTIRVSDPGNPVLPKLESFRRGQKDYKLKKKHEQVSSWLIIPYHECLFMSAMRCIVDRWNLWCDKMHKEDSDSHYVVCKFNLGYSMAERHLHSIFSGVNAGGRRASQVKSGSL